MDDKEIEVIADGLFLKNGRLTCGVSFVLVCFGISLAFGLLKNHIKKFLLKCVDIIRKRC